MPNLSRREFIAGSAAVVASVSIVPATLLGFYPTPDHLLIECTEYIAHNWMDSRVLLFEPAPFEIIGGVRTSLFDGAVPIVFNGRHYEPAAGWSNPWPYGKIRANE